MKISYFLLAFLVLLIPSFANAAGVGGIIRDARTPPSLRMTYTGELRQDIPIMATPFWITIRMGTNITQQASSNGLAIDSFVYTEAHYPTNGGLTNLVVENVEWARTLNILNCFTLTNVTFSSLKGVGGVSIGLSGTPKLQSLNFPELESGAQGSSLPSPTTISSTNFKSISLPKLRSAGTVSIVGSGGSPYLTSVDLPSLENAYGSISINSWTNLTNITIPNLRSIRSFSGNSDFNLTNVVLGSVGTLKSMEAVSFTTAKLTTNCVNNLLEVLSSLDGTSNTVKYVSTISITGGTSASSNGTNQAWINKLRAQGATVTLNVNPNYPN